jgi:c-di-GMP-binding flagellar brake protein YcgR
MNIQNNIASPNDDQIQIDSFRSLEQIHLPVGSTLQLQIDNTCYSAKLIGYFQGQSFIISMAEENQFSPSFLKDKPVLVRCYCENHIYIFNTVLIHISSEPFSHVHLAYPTKVRLLQERQFNRVKVNINGSANSPEGKRFSCLVQDISIGGALIALNGQTGEVSEPLLLTLNVILEGIEYELSLESEIRSVRLENSANSFDSFILQGLTFHDLSKQDILVLATFDLLPDWNAGT